LLDYSYGTVVTYGPTNAQITEFFKARDGRFHLNQLVVYGTNEITLYPLSDDVPVVYEIPSRELFYFHLYPDGRLLVADDSLQWWLLHPQAAPQSLGILPPFTIDEVEFRLGGDGAFSSDGRWVITKRDWHTDLYQLRDIERGIVVLETTVEELLIVQYTADKILLRERSYLTEESGEKGILYLAEEQRTIFLPDAPTGRWWELLPDGRLLYEEEPTSEIRTPGIYVYDVATEEFAPLLLNVKQIWLRRDFNR
jgi:hypothetical protein